MSDNKRNLIAIGYLYNLWAGELREYGGEVYHGIYCDSAYFLVKDKHGRVVKKLNCAMSEGEIHNKTVWLQESNKRKAADILIEHEEEQIAKLRFQIENHEKLIASLKNI